MQYCLQQEINVGSGSASALSRNLSIMQEQSKGLTYAAVVHKNQVCLVGWDEKLAEVSQEVVQAKDPSPTAASVGGGKSLTVLQATYVNISNRSNPVLVVCTPTGVLIYEWNGSSVLLWHPLPGIKPDASANYTLGAAAVADLLCTGTSAGELLAFTVKSNSVKFKFALGEHPVGITDVASNSRDVFASVSHDGLLAIWDAGLKLKNKISTGHPVSCVAVYRDNAIVATVLGIVLVYQSDSGELLCEIAAHARCIHSIDVVETAQMFLTVSEDSFARIWKFGQAASVQVECLQSECVKNAALVGGSFMSVNKADAFALTAYDHSTIWYFSKTKAKK